MASSTFSAFVKISTVIIFLTCFPPNKPPALAHGNHDTKISPSPQSPNSFPIYHITFLKNNDSESFALRRRKSTYTETPLISKRGAYLVRVRLGSQKLIAHLLLDTGSRFTWWQCSTCRKCYEQYDVLYNPTRSSSYRTLDCHNPDCNRFAAPNIGCEQEIGSDTGRCTYMTRYADNDTSSGVLAHDIIRNEDGTLFRQVVFGCGEENQGKYYNGFYSGVLGFGRHPYSFLGQFDVRNFSFCLGGADSQTTLYLNEIPPMDDDRSTFHTSLITAWNRPQDYYIEFEGISMDGVKVPIAPHKWKFNPKSAQYGVFIDTGTIITRFPTEVYNTFRQSFDHSVENFELLDEPVNDLLDTCYQ
ncbi:hypothetical protein Tsubulata_047461, partial [Turnera subulata]